MTASFDASRRAALRLLAGAPLLPVAGFTTLSLLPASAAGAAPRARVPTSVEIIGMAAPTTPEAQAATTVESSLVLGYGDGATQTYKLGYQPLFYTGDRVPDGTGGKTLAGGYYDIHGKPILDRSAGTPTQFYSDNPDGYSLLKLPGAKARGVRGNTLFAVVQFEATSRDAKGAKMYGRLPAPVAVLTLDQDRATGALRLVKYHTVDASKAHGLWTTCGASLSPWNTHLASEEYEPDAVFVAADAQFKAFIQYL